MRNIIFVLLFLPFIVCGQPTATTFYRDIEEIPADYKPDQYKTQKKETVALLREYLENKDRQLEDVEMKMLAVSNEQNKCVIDTFIANRFLSKVANSPKTAAIDDDIKRLLKQMGLSDQLDGKKVIGDLDVVTDMVRDKEQDYVGCKASAKKLASSRINIKNDISQAHKRIDQLYGFLYDDGNFRIWITGIFSGIVGALLILFFIFIGRNAESNLTKDFLTSGNGLQFIALFSLIIAIILFGVLGILEGRELAAILSGISGYILGKGIATPKTAVASGKADHGSTKHEAKNQTDA